MRIGFLNGRESRGARTSARVRALLVLAAAVVIAAAPALAEHTRWWRQSLIRGF